jgi:hypothetical protein
MSSLRSTVLRDFRVSVACTVALTVTVAACGPSQREYDATQKRASELAARVAELEKQVDELNNGAVRRLHETEAAFDARRYDDAVKVAALLADKHPGSPEAHIASVLADKAKAHIEEARKRAAADIEANRRNAELSAQQVARKVVRIAKIETDTPNSAGGVDLYITAYNTSKKTIKYARFSVTAFNAVGDPVRCTIRYWGNAWYNSTVVKGKLTGVSIEYMDGSKVTLRGAELKYVQF